MLQKLSPKTVEALSTKINEISGFTKDALKEGKKPLGPMEGS